MNFGLSSALASSGMVYLGVYLAVSLLAITQNATSWSRFQWAVVGLALTIFIGLRYKVGGDWYEYQKMLVEAGSRSFLESLYMRDPAYQVLNWMGYNLFGGVYFPNIICASIASFSLIYFCSTRQSPLVSLLVATPYLIIVVFMAYTRQSAAMGMVLIAIMSLEKNDLKNAFLATFAASLFHFSAAAFFIAIIIQIIWTSWGNIKAIKAIQITSIAIVLFAILFGSAGIWQKLEVYLGFQHNINVEDSLAGSNLDPVPDQTDVVLRDQSSISPNMPLLSAPHSIGAIPRLAILAMAAALFLFSMLRQKRINRGDVIWMVMSVASIVLLPLSLFFSTLSDRFGLFLMPLQMHVFSNISSSLLREKRSIFKLSLIVLLGLTLIIWLNFSQYSKYWYPYNNILFVFGRGISLG